MFSEGCIWEAFSPLFISLHLLRFGFGFFFFYSVRVSIELGCHHCFVLFCTHTHIHPFVVVTYYPRLIFRANLLKNVSPFLFFIFSGTMFSSPLCPCETEAK